MLARTSWSVEALRNRRLALVHERLGARQQDLQSSPILLCVSEILTPKKGEATDYVSRQFDSNTAQYKRGILALLSCCIVGNETFPLRFRVFKPQGRLQDGELFASKAKLQEELLQELKDMGFQPDVALLSQSYTPDNNLPSVFVQKELLLAKEVRTSRRRRHHQEQCTAESRRQSQCNCEKGGTLPTEKHPTNQYVRFKKVLQKPGEGIEHVYSILTDMPNVAKEDLDFFCQHRQRMDAHILPLLQQLGWSDFRLTQYEFIERWWEIVLSSYTMVALHTTSSHNNLRGKEYDESHTNA